ncbi:MAG TPA: Ig-like domain-containing protein [Longimicrobiales bacterium]|nr:Ig-like domain-containing protein [Longimicrobiales bacterium]
MRPLRRGWAPLVVAGVGLLAACGDSGPVTGPPAAVTASAVPASSVVGAVFSPVYVTVKDADGRALEGVAVAWHGDGQVDPAESTTDDQGIARTVWTLDTVAGVQTLTATVGSLEPATFTIEARAADVAQLSITPPGRSLHALGDTLELALDATDAYGNDAPVPGLSWTSLDPAVATVAGGTVTAVTEGVARIEATGQGMADTVEVEVDQVVAGLGLTPDSAIMAVAEQVQLTAVPVDSGGAPVDTVVTPTWSSSDAAVASVSGSGLVDALAAGNAVITASAGDYSGQAALDVRSGARPSITSITPAVAVPGSTLTITGTDFAPTAADNTVTVAGVAGTVATASATELTVELGLGGFPCAPTQPVDVVVSADGLDATTEHPLAGADQRTLAAGESVTLTGAGVRCNELTEGGSYLVSVFNTSTTPTASTAFTLRGSVAGAVAAAATSPDMLVASAASRRTLRLDNPRQIAERPEEAAHARILERNLRLGQELQRQAGPVTGLRRQMVAADAPPAAGSYVDLRVPDIDAANACTSYHDVTARVAHVGTRAVILEDTLAPLAGQMDATWADVGDEMDNVMYQVLLDYFGDPLVMDDQLDDNDRLLMLFTEQVNDFQGGVAGFVFSGDFFPRTGTGGCASSDQAEIFYGIVPTSSASGYDGNTVDAWFRDMRSTVIHEVKHITSFAHRLHNDADQWEAQWLEESTARLAEEFYARAVFGYGQHGNTGYQESLYCEVRPDWPECSGRPWVMGKHFIAIMEYYRNLETLSAIGPAMDGDWTYYGSGWLLVRWALDHSGQTEAAFVQSLISETSLAGVESLAARTGRSFPEMLADFSLAMAADDHPDVTPSRAELTFPSWDTRDVYQGFSNDFPDYPAFPLEPRAVSFGDFDVEVQQLQGGSASVMELSGALTGGQLLELVSTAGGAAPPNLGIAILRVE